MLSEPERTVGLIGLGLLGSALSDRLRAAGYSVVGFDVDQAASERFRAAGGHAVQEVQTVAAECIRVILSLPNSDVVESVLGELRSTLQPGTVVIDTTTGDPKRTCASADIFRQQGIELIDATVLGSSTVTREGQALLMVGGSNDAVDQCRNVLTAISTEIHHLGPVGSGQRMKLVANLVLGLNRAVLAEGLHFAKTLGLDLNCAINVLSNGAAYSRVMDAKGHKMITGDFEPQARLSQHLKDVKLILKYADLNGTRLPLSQVHQQLLQTVEAAGDGGLDNSAIVRAWSD